MNRIELRDVYNLIEYEKIRTEFRARVVEAKKHRRIGVGDIMTFVFENRDTVHFQIQEMVRTERLVKDADIQHEIDTYNMLIPSENELKATLLIEIQELSQIKKVLDDLVGLPKGCVWIDVNGERIDASFDLEQSDDDRISAVQYITFPFTQMQRTLFMNASQPASIVIAHPNYGHSAPLAGALRASLIADFTA